MSKILVLFFACCAGLAAADQQLPETYQDDLYHCQDPTLNQNPIRCDPETYLWDLGDLNPNEQPDDSLLCQEIVKILVKAREQQNLDAGLEQAQETQIEVELWETIMETSVVDQLEPCVLWAVSFGPLTPYAQSMGLYDERGPKPEPEQKAEEVWEEVGVFEDVAVKLAEPAEEKPERKNNDDTNEKPVDVPADMDDDTSDPISTMLETEFDSFMIGIAWTVPLGRAISLDRTELHGITGRHILDALKAELGSDKVAHLDLTLTASPPDYDAQILPLTLSGRVVFGDHLEALGSTNLQKLILKSAFVDVNARDLYLFRLKLSDDDTLQTVSTVVVGKEDIALYTLQEPSRNENDKKSNSEFIETDLSEEDEEFVSKLLIAILAAVGAAILAVLLFAYFLMCRSKTSGKATRTLEEHSSSTGSGPSSSSFRKIQSLKQQQQQSYKDGVPAVRTAPTEDAIEEEESQYDIEYMAGGNDGVSDYDMDTLPPPSTLPDSDDDQSIVMSIMEGFDDENVEETVAGNTLSDDSDANASLYSYIPSDTSLSMSLTKEPTAMEKAQKKSILWSVEKQEKADSDMDNYSYDLSAAEHSYEKQKSPTSMLGPSNDESQSRDSSLLYATDDDELLNGAKQNMAEIPADYEPEESAPAEDGHPPLVESTSADEENGDDDDDDKKKKFEDLWKDENEIDEAASVLNYLESVQSARRAASTEQEYEPIDSLKIIDVATPVQTPERPLRPEDNQMLPLPATLDSAFQDTASVSSSLSGSSPKQSPAAKDDDSIRSTDSSKLRRLLGQGDMNDAALVFGEQTQKDDASGSAPDAEVSMSSCTSNQLKSLLTKTDSKDAGSDDDEDFLFSKSDSRRNLEEEKKEIMDFEDEDDEKDNGRPNYLPAAITPRNQPNELPKQQMVNISPADDASVQSALSDAPSVDETIASNMGWF